MVTSADYSRPGLLSSVEKARPEAEHRAEVSLHADCVGRDTCCGLTGRSKHSNKGCAES